MNAAQTHAKILQNILPQRLLAYKLHLNAAKEDIYWSMKNCSKILRPSPDQCRKQCTLHRSKINWQLSLWLNCKRFLPDGVWREISNCCFTFTTQVFRQLSRHKLAGHRAPGKDVVSIHSSLFVVLKLFSGAHGPWSWDAIIQWFLPHDRELKNTYQFLFWILLSGVKPTWSESDKLISLNFKFLFWCLKKNFI